MKSQGKFTQFALPKASAASTGQHMQTVAANFCQHLVKIRNFQAKLNSIFPHQFNGKPLQPIAKPPREIRPLKTGGLKLLFVCRVHESFFRDKPEVFFHLKACYGHG